MKVSIDTFIGFNRIAYMIKGVYWPDNFWTIEDFKVKVDLISHRLKISASLLCDGDKLEKVGVKGVDSNNGIVFSASFDSIRKMAKIVCDDNQQKKVTASFLANYILNNIGEGLADKIYEDYLPNVRESKDYEGNGKDEEFLKDYCLTRLAKDQQKTIKKTYDELTRKLTNIL